MNREGHRLWMVSLVFAASTAWAQPVPIDAGEYAISAVTATAGSAEGATPQKGSRCITAEDLANPESVFNNRFLAGFKADPSCTVSGLSISASKVSYATQCKYANVQVDAAITRTSFSVLRKASNKTGAGPGAESRIEGKRIGACK
jgi:hypothetical protein